MTKKIKVFVGKAPLHWPFALEDEQGMIIGIHFGRGREFSKEQRRVIMDALKSIAVSFDEINEKKRKLLTPELQNER